MTVTDFPSALEARADTAARRSRQAKILQESRDTNMAPLVAGMSSLKESGKHILELSQKNRAGMEFRAVADVMKERGQSKMAIDQLEGIKAKYPALAADMAGTIDDLKLRANILQAGATGGVAISAVFAPFTAAFEVLNTSDETQKSMLSPLLWAMNFGAKLGDELFRVPGGSKEKEERGGLSGRIANWVNGTVGKALIGDEDFVVDNIDDFKAKYFVEHFWNEVAPPLGQVGVFKVGGKVAGRGTKGFVKEFLKSDGTLASSVKEGVRQGLGIKNRKERTYSPEQITILDAMERMEKAGDRAKFGEIVKQHPDMLLEYAKLKNERFAGISKMKEIFEKAKKGEKIEMGDKVYMTNWAKRTFERKTSSHEPLNDLIRKMEESPERVGEHFDNLMAEFTGMIINHPTFWESVRGTRASANLPEQVGKATGLGKEAKPAEKMPKLEVGKMGKFREYEFKPEVDTTAKGGELIAVVKRSDGLSSVVRAKNGKLDTLSNKISKEIGFHEKNNPMKESTKAIPKAAEPRKSELLKKRSSLIEDMKKTPGSSVLASELGKIDAALKKIDTSSKAGKPVGGAADIFRIRKGDGFEKVEGKKIEIDPRYEAFIRKEGGNWIITESKSGQLVASSRTRKEAIGKAKDMMEKIKPETWKQQIDKSIKEMGGKEAIIRASKFEKASSFSEAIKSAPEAIRKDVEALVKGEPISPDSLPAVNKHLRSQGLTASRSGIRRLKDPKTEKIIEKSTKEDLTDKEYAKASKDVYEANKDSRAFNEMDILNIRAMAEAKKVGGKAEELANRYIQKDPVELKLMQITDYGLRDVLPVVIKKILNPIRGGKELGQKWRKSVDDATVKREAAVVKTGELWKPAMESSGLGFFSKMMNRAEIEAGFSKAIFEAFVAKDFGTLKNKFFEGEVFKKVSKENMAKMRAEAVKTAETIKEFMNEARVEVIKTSKKTIEKSEPIIKEQLAHIKELTKELKKMDDRSPLATRLNDVKSSKIEFVKRLKGEVSELKSTIERLEAGGKGEHYIPHMKDPAYIDLIAEFFPEQAVEIGKSSRIMSNDFMNVRSDFPFIAQSAIYARGLYEQRLIRDKIYRDLLIETEAALLNNGVTRGTAKGDYYHTRLVDRKIFDQRPGKEGAKVLGDRVAAGLYGAVGSMEKAWGKDIKFLQEILTEQREITKAQYEYIRDTGVNIEDGFKFTKKKDGGYIMEFNTFIPGENFVSSFISLNKKLIYSGTIGMSPRTTSFNVITQPTISAAFSGLGMVESLVVLKDGFAEAARQGAFSMGAKGKEFRKKMAEAGLLVSADQMANPEVGVAGRTRGVLDSFTSGMLANMPWSEGIARFVSAYVGHEAFKRGKLTKADIGEIVEVNGVKLSTEWSHKHNFRYNKEDMGVIADYEAGRAALVLSTFTIKNWQLHIDLWKDAKWNEFFENSRKIVNNKELGYAKQFEMIIKEYAKDKNRYGFAKEAVYGLATAMVMGQIFDVDFDEFMVTGNRLSISNPFTNLFLGAGGFQTDFFDSAKVLIPGRSAVRSLDKALGTDVLSNRDYGSVPKLFSE